MNPTHEKGHILHLMFAEMGNMLEVVECFVGELITDHRKVECSFKIAKENMEKKTITFRKWSQVNKDDLGNSLKQELKEIEKLTDLWEYVKEFGKRILTIVDTKVSEITKLMVDHKKKVWFSEEIHEQRRTAICRGTI